MGVGFLGSGVAYSSDAIQRKLRGHGRPVAGWPTRRQGPMPKMPPQAKKIKTRVVRAGKLMVVDPEAVYEGDEVLGDEAEYEALGPGWDYEVEAEPDDWELESGTRSMPAAEWGEIGWGVAGYLEAGEPTVDGQEAG
jgi:hypothetical protein